ncbi:MAG: DUF3426 domain-containing protein [Hylemonella sp.]
MSLITRCPACQTMFKVVPDQLRISEGWVRCGKCEEIFDASAHMQEAVLPQGGAAEVPGQEAAPFEGALAAAIASDARRAGSKTGKKTKAAAEPAPQPASPDVDLELHEPAGDTVLEPVSGPGPLLDGSAYAAAGRAEPVFELDAQPVPRASASAELSFMRNASKSSRWHRPMVRATLLVACLLLGLGLALQILIHERDRLAVVEPGLKPLIEEACLLLDCQIEPLRQIESVVIDSSAFSKVKGDLYRLSLTLKNNASIDLAMPAVELALTDTLDHALMRRVFQPEELGVKTGVIPAASETQTTLVLTIKTNGAGERVAGYRLLAFYP